MSSDTSYIGSRSIAKIIDMIENGDSQFSKKELFFELKKKVSIMKKFNLSVIADNESMRKESLGVKSKHSDYDMKLKE